MLALTLGFLALIGGFVTLCARLTEPLPSPVFGDI